MIIIKILISFMFLLLTACSNLPDPPKLNLYIVTKEKDKFEAIPCTLINPNKFQIKCDASKAFEMNENVAGWFMLEPKDVQEMRAWAREILENYECKKK